MVRPQPVSQPAPRCCFSSASAILLAVAALFGCVEPGRGRQRAAAVLPARERVSAAFGTGEDRGGVLAAGDDGDPYIYISGFGPTLSRFRLDPDTGALYGEESTTIGGNPSYLAIAAATRRLYAVDEAAHGAVQAFGIAAPRADLEHLVTQRSGGAEPTHIALAASGRWLLAAHYGDGVVTSLPVLGDGSLGDVAAQVAAGSNAHEVVVGPTGRYVYVPCLGSDRIDQYTFDDQTGVLTPADPPFVSTPPGSGPRHLALHPSGRWAYAIQELDSTVTSYAVDERSGALRPVQTLSILPTGFKGNNAAAEIVVHPTGRMLFASNRGDNSIVTLSLDADTGRMAWAGRVASGGVRPRMVAVDASGRYLLAANQDSANVVVFRIGGASGDLQPVFTGATKPAPSFIGFAALAGH